eukprot:m.178601 g.178601  ORF g.178601 m.178601 type:complete len:252 (+) comp14578_c0_seq1:110-865(+)
MDVSANTGSGVTRRLKSNEWGDRKSEQAVRKLLDAISLSPGLGLSVEPSRGLRSCKSSSSRMNTSMTSSRSSTAGWDVPEEALAKARSTRQMVSFRIWDIGAINAPGVLYKAVAVTPSMTARDLIQECISKCGTGGNPAHCELRFAVDYDDTVPKKKRTEPAKVLDADECPYLVAEWYTDLPRRFEIHPVNAHPEKNKSKFYKYWNSPLPTSSRRRASVATTHQHRRSSMFGSSSKSRRSSEGSARSSSTR